MKRITILPRIVLSLCLLGGAGPAFGQTNLIAVIDGSSSMYDRINGEFKLLLAQRAVRELAAALPADSRVGVIAYGHREQRSCDDIETVVPFAAPDLDRLNAGLDRLRARGKAPLSAALQRAFGLAQQQRRPTTILLLTDGVDNCGYDPCATVRNAASRGIPFTMQIIGFRVNQETAAVLNCMADASAGEFVNVRRVSELDDTLGHMLFAAVDHSRRPTTAGRPATTAPGATAAVSGQAEAADTVVLAAPEQVDAGSRFDVGWRGRGPDGSWDYITLVEADAADAEYGSYNYIREGNPLTFRAPRQAGDYELRYVHGTTQQVLARQDLKVR